MPELTVTLDDGTTAPLAKCDWVFYKPCGCPRGVMDAVSVEWILHNEGLAFYAFFDDGSGKRKTEALVRREIKRGVTAELMTHQRYVAEISPAMRSACPHMSTGGAA